MDFVTGVAAKSVDYRTRAAAKFLDCVTEAAAVGLALILAQITSRTKSPVL